MAGSLAISVPGKIMLAGEYSVLLGGSALAICINRYLTVRCLLGNRRSTPLIASSLWHEPRDPSLDWTSCYQQEESTSHWQIFFHKLLEPFYGLIDRVSIISDLDPTFGFGSSSALRVAMLKLHEQLTLRYPQRLIKPQFGLYDLFAMQKSAQGGKASGYDLITQTVGGVILSHPLKSGDFDPNAYHRIVPVNNFHEFFSIFVGGRGAPTGKTIAAHRYLLDVPHIKELMNDLIEALLIQSPRAFAKTLQINNLMSVSPDYPPLLRSLRRDVGGYGTCWGIKTTGAGGEDALLVMGRASDRLACEQYLENSGLRKLEIAIHSCGPLVKEFPEGCTHEDFP